MAALEWLLNEVRGTSLDGVKRQRGARPTRYDDDRHNAAAALECFLKRQAIDTWHIDVEQNAADSLGICMVKELHSRIPHCDLIAGALQHEAHRLADCRLIIDNVDDLTVSHEAYGPSAAQAACLKATGVTHLRIRGLWSAATSIGSGMSCLASIDNQPLA
jgi:hypothetical protein